MGVAAAVSSLFAGRSERVVRALIVQGMAVALLLPVILPRIADRPEAGRGGPSDAPAVSGVASPRSPCAQCEESARLSRILHVPGRPAAATPLPLAKARSSADPAGIAACGPTPMAAGGPGDRGPICLLI